MTEKTRRRHAPFFDRLKIVIFLGVVIAFFVWKDTNDPFTTVGESFTDFSRTTLGALLIAGFLAEVIRQAHYLVAEVWAGYNHFWVERVFAGSERQVRKRVGDFTRYRIRRVVGAAFVVVVYGLLAMLFRDDVGSVGDAITRAPEILVDLLPVILQFMFFGALVMFQFVAIFWFLSRGGIDIVFPEDIETRFDGVWGQDHVLDLVRENIAFLEKPDEIEEKGGYIPGGILLWGPPGTGKTLMAEAIAGEVGKPFVFVDPGAFIQMFFGVGILKVKRLFRKLRKLSLRHGGVVVFFDEADSLGNRGMLSGGPGPFQPHEAPAHSFCNGISYLSGPGQRHVLEAAGLFETAATGGNEPSRGSLIDRMVMGAGMGGGGMGTLQALLTEISGLTKPRGIGNRVRRILGMKPKPPPKYRILIIMATNMPNSLDQAMLRPGRIDRIYKVGYPSKEGRRKTFEGYLEKVSNDLTDDQVDKIATTTAYYSGAKIKDLVNEALILAIRDDRTTVTFQDVWRAKALKELGPPEDAEYIVRERHAVAIHEASHAVAAHLLSTRRSIDMVTIERRGNVGGFMRSLDIEDRFTSWRTELEADIKVSLASLAGERMFFESDNSSGVTGDLRNATQLVSYMQGVYGMGDQLSSFLALQAGQFGGGDPAEKVLGRMGKKVEERLKQLYDEVSELLHDHREKVLELAHVLVAERTISGDRVTEVMGSDPGLMGIHEPVGFGKFDPDTNPIDAASLPRRASNGGAKAEGDAVLASADEVDQ